MAIQEQINAASRRLAESMTTGEAQFTKRPWNIWQEGGIHSDDYTIEGVGKFKIPNYANMKLIAAGTLMYEALLVAEGLALVDGNEAAAAYFRETLAKARGES